MAEVFVRGDVVREVMGGEDAPQMTVERLAGDTWQEGNHTCHQLEGTVGVVWFEGAPPQLKRKSVKADKIVKERPTSV